MTQSPVLANATSIRTHVMSLSTRNIAHAQHHNTGFVFSCFVLHDALLSNGNREEKENGQREREVARNSSTCRRSPDMFP